MSSKANKNNQHHNNINNNKSQYHKYAKERNYKSELTADKQERKNYNCRNNNLVNGALGFGTSSSKSLKILSNSASDSRTNSGQHHNRFSNHNHSNHEKPSPKPSPIKMSTDSASKFSSGKSSAKKASPSPSWKGGSSKIKKAKDKEKERNRKIKDKSPLASPSLKASKSTSSSPRKQSPKRASSILRTFTSPSNTSSIQSRSNHESHHHRQHSHFSSSPLNHRPPSSHLSSSKQTNTPTTSRSSTSSSTTRVNNCNSSPAKPPKSSKTPSSSSSSKSWLYHDNAKSSPQKANKIVQSKVSKHYLPRNISTQNDQDRVNHIDDVPSPPGRAALKGPKASQFPRSVSHPNGLIRSRSSASNSHLLTSINCAANEDYREECSNFINNHRCEEDTCPKEQYEDFDKMQFTLEQRCIRLENKRLRLKAEKKAYTKMMNNIPGKKSDRTKKDSAAYFLQTYTDPDELIEKTQLNAASGIALKNNSSKTSSLISKPSKRRRHTSNSDSDTKKSTSTAPRPTLLLSSITTANMLGNTCGSLISEEIRKKAKRNNQMLVVKTDKNGEQNVYCREVNERYEQFSGHCQRLFGADLSRELHFQPLQTYIQQDSFLDIVQEMLDSKRSKEGMPKKELENVIKKEEEEIPKRSTRSLSRNHSVDQMDLSSLTFPNGNNMCMKKRNEFDALFSKKAFLNGYKVPRINGALRSATSLSSASTERQRSRSPSSNLNKTHACKNTGNLFNTICTDHFGSLTREHTRFLLENVLVDEDVPDAIKKEVNNNNNNNKPMPSTSSSSSVLSLRSRESTKSNPQLTPKKEENGLPVKCDKYRTADGKLNDAIKSTLRMLTLMNDHLALYAPDCDPGCARGQLAESLLLRSVSSDSNQSTQALQPVDVLDWMQRPSTKAASASSLLPPPSTPVLKRRGRKSRSSSINGNCTPVSVTPVATPNSPRNSTSSFSFNVPTTRGRKRSYAESMESTPYDSLSRMSSVSSDSCFVEQDESNHKNHHYDMRQLNGFGGDKEDSVDFSVDQWTRPQPHESTQKPRNYAQIMELIQQQSLESDSLDKSLNTNNPKSLALALIDGTCFAATVSGSEWCPDLEKEQPMLRTDPIGFSQPQCSKLNSTDVSREASVDRDWNGSIKLESSDENSSDVDTKDSAAAELNAYQNLANNSNLSCDAIDAAIEKLLSCLGYVASENMARIAQISQFVDYELANQELRGPIATQHIIVADAMCTYLKSPIGQAKKPKEKAKLLKLIKDLLELKEKHSNLLNQLQARASIAKCWQFPKLSWVNGRARSELDFVGDFYDL